MKYHVLTASTAARAPFTTRTVTPHVKPRLPALILMTLNHLIRDFSSKEVIWSWPCASPHIHRPGTKHIKQQSKDRATVLCSFNAYCTKLTAGGVYSINTKADAYVAPWILLSWLLVFAACPLPVPAELSRLCPLSLPGMSPPEGTLPATFLGSAQIPSTFFNKM